LPLPFAPNSIQAVTEIYKAFQRYMKVADDSFGASRGILPHALNIVQTGIRKCGRHLDHELEQGRTEFRAGLIEDRQSGISALLAECCECTWIRNNVLKLTHVSALRDLVGADPLDEVVQCFWRFRHPFTQLRTLVDLKEMAKFSHSA